MIATESSRVAALLPGATLAPPSKVHARHVERLAVVYVRQSTVQQVLEHRESTALELAGIDARGLDDQDRAYLRTIIDIYEGGPVGVEAVAATMGEERDTLEDVIEPYLLQQGLITRTRQGRRATKSAYEHLGLKYRPPKELPESGLFTAEE